MSSRVTRSNSNVQKHDTNLQLETPDQDLSIPDEFKSEITLSFRCDPMTGKFVPNAGYEKAFQERVKVLKHSELREILRRDPELADKLFPTYNRGNRWCTIL